VTASRKGAVIAQRCGTTLKATAAQVPCWCEPSWSNTNATYFIPVASYQSQIVWSKSRWELAIASSSKNTILDLEGVMWILRTAENAPAIFAITLVCALVFLSAVIPA